MSRVLIAFTGRSGVGKSYLSDCLVNLGNYQKLSFSTALKEMYPSNQKDLRTTYIDKDGELWQSYKHFLCSRAELINVKFPDQFIDDLRSPRQLRKLSDFCSVKGLQLITVRVTNSNGKSVSYMDDYLFPVDATYLNNYEPLAKFTAEMAKIIHSI